jgi:hypothetical protein
LSQCSTWAPFTTRRVWLYSPTGLKPVWMVDTSHNRPRFLIL